MRAKSEIISKLSRNLTSDIWKKLRNSLLGRELLALGGEIIFENENVKDTLLLQLSPDTADEGGLYMLAQMNEVPITARKPASLVVVMKDDSKTYAPFELRHNIGNQSFYNIEYTMSGKTVSLLHGTFKYYLRGNAVADSVDLANGSRQTELPNPLICDGGEMYEYINLGNAYPDSIIVKRADGTEFQRYSSDNALSDSVGIVYKVFSLNDGSQCVRFMNGDTPTDFKIEWLDHSAGTADYDDNIEVKDGNNTVAKIQYSSDGEEDDLAFMRSQLKKEMAKYDGLNTPKSVENYANSMPYVIDSKCSFDEKGRICVYIKPSMDIENEVGGYLDYSEIAAHVALNSLMFPNIKVVNGKRLLFGLTISGIREDAIRNYAKQVIQQRYAYDSIGFSSAVNTSEIVADIYSKYGVTPSITMTLRENFTVDEQLSYVPERNSIKGFDLNGATTLTENNGVLYSTLPVFDIMNLFDVVCCVGNMVLFRKYREYRKFNDANYTSSIDSSERIDNVATASPSSMEYAMLDDFYLWDASSNTLKPFDENIVSLLSKANNTWFTGDKDIWGASPNTFHIMDGTRDETYDGTNYKGVLNMRDIQVLSTNNMVVFNFVLTSNGLDKGLTEGTAGTLQNELYNFYKKNGGTDSTAYGLEHDTNLKGCYQLSICVSNNIFRNILSESWGEVKNVFYGLNNNDAGNGIEGFYDGFKGWQQFGTNLPRHLDLKANSFHFEGVMYYPKTITASYIELANNVTDIVLTISTSSELKGLVEQDGVLYVIQSKNVTVVEGFSGIKQRSKTYTIYRNYDPFLVEDIVVGLNGYLMIKSSDGFYSSTGVEVRDSVSATFANLNKLFVDKYGEDYVFKGKDDVTINLSELTIGSCTSEYATCYKKDRNKPVSDVEGATATSTLDFYCYDIKNKTTQSYYNYNETTRYYVWHQTDGELSFEIVSPADTNVGGEMNEIGVMDYDNSRIIVNGSADLSSIATIQYNGITSNNKEDSYIVLNESDIKFI